jgi:hypothetical protein
MGALGRRGERPRETGRAEPDPQHPHRTEAAPLRRRSAGDRGLRGLHAVRQAARGGDVVAAGGRLTRTRWTNGPRARRSSCIHVRPYARLRRHEAP